MTQETWLADEVEVTASGVFATRHLLETATGILGELTLPALKMRGVFRAADGRALVMERTSWWRGTHELREGEEVRGTAHPRGIFHRVLDLQFDRRAYTLRTAGFWGRVWHLVDGAGATLLEIRPRGVFRRGGHVRVLASVDLDLLVFAYYLVNALWQEQTAAASAGAAAGS